MTSLPLSSISSIQKIKSYCHSLLKKNGTIVGNTKEQPINGSFIIAPDDLTVLVDNLKPFLNKEILEKETEEYNGIEKAATQICLEEFARDINGRRAVVINNSCLSYHHFYLRDGILFHVVHMRSQDIRKFLEDFWLMLRAHKSIIKNAIPEGYVIKNIQLRYEVDCFHEYLKPEEVAL